MENEKTKFSVFKKNPVSDHVRAYLAANKIEWVRRVKYPKTGLTAFHLRRFPTSPSQANYPQRVKRNGD